MIHLLSEKCQQLARVTRGIGAEVASRVFSKSELVGGYAYDSSSVSSLKLATAIARSGIFSVRNLTKFPDGQCCEPKSFFATPKILKRFNLSPRNLEDKIYFDKAYFGRETFMRCTYGGYQQKNLVNVDEKKFKNLNIQYSLKRIPGKYILICPQSSFFHEYSGEPRSEWIESIKEQLSSVTDRPVRVRLKQSRDTEKSFHHDLKDCHAVIVMSSVAGIQATLYGKPCYATDSLSAAASVSISSFDEIEDPYIPDNAYEVWCNLANNQWSVDEIKSGEFYRELLRYKDFVTEANTAGLSMRKKNQC